MVFRRRDRRPFWRLASEAVYPRGGWGRAVEYVKHRLRRLPDSPEKIGRGMAAGAFVSFTPFFGLHFVLALLLARAMRGNYLAALIGTFVNNVVTLVPIGALCVTLGYFLLGMPLDDRLLGELGQLFAAASADLWQSFLAVFTPARADWGWVGPFWGRVFLPYLVGGLGPGVVVAAACYWLTVPLVRAYQAGRRRALADRLARLREGGGPR
jgi:hypothetical protein